MADLLTLFVMPPGNLLYFLAIIAVSQAALYITVDHGLRSPEQASIQRYSKASLGIVLGWVLLGIGVIIGLFTAQPGNTILPPLEHIINTWVLLLVSWVFITAENPTSNRLWDIITLILLGLLAIGGLITLTQWLPLAALIDFNSTVYALAWTFLPLVLSIFMLLILFLRVRAIPDAPLKMVFFVILLAGYGISTIQIANNTLFGNYIGSLRASFLLAMPFYVLVLYRYITNQLVAAPASSQAPQAPPITAPKTPRLQVSTPSTDRESVQLLRALGDMLSGAAPADLPQQITIAAANTLKADIVALGMIQDANWVDIVAAYDNIQQKPSHGMALNLDEQPTLTAVIERAIQRPLAPDTNTAEIVDLYTRLDIIQSGPLGTAYFQPLKQNKQTFAVLILLFPYTGRELSDSETALLEGLAPIAGKLLSLTPQADSPAPMTMVTPSDENMSDIDYSAAINARLEMQSSLETAHAEINNLSKTVQDLKSELEGERRRIVQVLATDEETMSISQQIMALGEESNQIEVQRDELANELQEAQTMLVGATASGNDDLYHTMINILSREQQTLAAQKNNLEQQLNTLREQTNDMFLVPASIQETLQTFNQEKSRLINERDNIATELENVKSELALLGVEGGVAGLALVLGQLYEERDQLKAQLQQAAQSAPTAVISHTQDVSVATLQEELARLAADREAALKQRDALRHEQATWNTERTEWQAQRQRLGQQISSIQQSIKNNNQQRDRLLRERNALAEERSGLIEERDRLLAASTALQTERDQLLAQVKGDRELLQQFGADGVETLKAMIDDLTAERSTLEHQILQTQADLDLMEGKLQAFEQSGLTPTSQSQATPQFENPEVLLSIAQELRTPMSSITGYTDLLLGESVGILGALQRKFLQRVKANIERLSSLTEDMISVIALDSGQLNLEPEPTNMLDLLDDIITNASTQFREKEITLELAIADYLPPVQVDRDAIQQVLTQLLSNAYLVSPTEGQVSITARQEQVAYTDEHGSRVSVPSLYFMIQDQGGGIPLEDQQRVFTRLYRADNPLIQGIGDTGVGLSIVRTLVEAHNGNIWVESEIGIGTRFIFTIPLQALTEG